MRIKIFNKVIDVNMKNANKCFGCGKRVKYFYELWIGGMPTETGICEECYEERQFNESINKLG